MKKLYRVKHQYDEEWLSHGYQDYNIDKAFYDDPSAAVLFDNIEEVYKLIEDENLEVRIETIYCGDNT